MLELSITCQRDGQIISSGTAWCVASKTAPPFDGVVVPPLPLSPSQADAGRLRWKAVQQRHAGQRPRLVRAADAEAGTVVEVSAYSEFDVASAVPLAQITGGILIGMSEANGRVSANVGAAKRDIFGNLAITNASKDSARGMVLHRKLWGGQLSNLGNWMVPERAAVADEDHKPAAESSVLEMSRYKEEEVSQQLHNAVDEVRAAVQAAVHGCEARKAQAHESSLELQVAAEQKQEARSLAAAGRLSGAEFRVEAAARRSLEAEESSCIARLQYEQEISEMRQHGEKEEAETLRRVLAAEEALANSMRWSGQNHQLGLELFGVIQTSPASSGADGGQEAG
ncbi:unnamed protein product [Symbiodinium pilosum]|uniref:Uncharacterized protein n=1 Tax=Symbiodinium pilosum TaxID=2952 RepID=A0A812VYV5_SYMPI|nr:unnamed protein product [Symbiodinium pilosum]